MIQAATYQTQKSPAPKSVRGMILWSNENCERLFTEHLPEHILQRTNLVGSKCGDTVFQTSFVDGSNLIGSHLAVAPHDMASHPIGIAVNRRRDGNDNHRIKIFVQLLGTNDSAGTDFLHLCTNGGIQVNPIDIELAYHFQSSIVSSSNTSATIRLSSPSACACLAAAAQPSRGAMPASFFWARTKSLTKAITFVIADSLSSSGFISRNSSARSCIAVIILTYLFTAAKLRIIIE